MLTHVWKDAFLYRQKDLKPSLGPPLEGIDRTKRILVPSKSILEGCILVSGKGISWYMLPITF